MTSTQPDLTQPRLDREAILRLTDEDEALHQKAIQKVLTQLFRKYKAEEFFFVPNTFKVERPLVSFTVGPSGVDRRLCLGGVRYDFESPRGEERLEISIRHSEGSQFNVFVSVHKGGQIYTRLATTIGFRELDEHVYKCVQAVRGEHAIR